MALARLQVIRAQILLGRAGQGGMGQGGGTARPVSLGNFPGLGFSLPTTPNPSTPREKRGVSGMLEDSSVLAFVLVLVSAPGRQEQV